jgi:hypothetical protein
VLVGAGGLAIMAAIGVSGWLTLAITGLGMGVTAVGVALGHVPWKEMFDQISSGVTSFGNALSWLWDKIKSLGSWIYNKTSYEGGGATFQPTMFTTGDGSSFSGFGGGTRSTAIGRSAALGSIDSTGNTALSGNSYVASVRSRFAQELQDPNTRLKFAAMLLSEGNPLQTAESAMNRSDMTHSTLMQALHGGFYGPINRGQLPKFMRELQSNPKLMARMNAAIGAALAGSDTIHGFTDQGMASDPNGRWILNHEHLWGSGHGNLYGDWGGMGHSAAEAWRHNFEAHAGASGAIPPRENPSVNINQPILLDGRVIANNTMKHIVGHGNSPQSGARSPDYLGTRPLSI